MFEAVTSVVVLHDAALRTMAANLQKKLPLFPKLLHSVATRLTPATKGLTYELDG